MGRFHRSETDRMIVGVCGGLAEYLGIDSIWVRVAAVLLAFFDGLGLLAYLLLWIIMPTQSKVPQHPREVAGAGGEETSEARELAPELRMGVGGGGYPLGEGTARQTRAGRSYTVAAVLILVGTIALAVKAAEFAWEARTSMTSGGRFMDDFGLLWWLDIGQLWPLILIAVGVVVLLRRRGA